MKNNYFLFCLIFSKLVYADPLLVAVLMVKNEELSMEMTLQPLIDAGIKDYLMYDTGSTDNTIQITRQIFEKNNISNYVIEGGEFVDFSTSRNKALALTEQYFPEAIFMLMLDAEWMLCNGRELLKFCEQERNNDELVVYNIRIKNEYVDFYHARLLRCNKQIKFFGRVHEVPEIPPQAPIPFNIYFELGLTHHGQEKTMGRFLRDVEMLLLDYQENPNSRTAYYLAQTYFCLQNWDNAIKWYEIRATMPGWHEENFWTYIRLAELYLQVGDDKKAVNFYLKAFEQRSNRAEPFIRLAALFYDEGLYYLSFLFAKTAVTMPYPEGEALPIEKALYDFVRYNLVSATAVCNKEYLLGKQATLQALKTYPDAQYLKQNLQMYEEKLAKSK